MEPKKTKILLVQLASNGDCLFVTAIARQIKEIDYPGCHLTWMIGSAYKNVIANNPYIDDIHEVPINSFSDVTPQRNRIKEHVAELKKTHYFDQVFITDYIGENLQNWFGTTRSSLFRSYPHQFKVNVEPQVFLTKDEIGHVRTFAEAYSLVDNKYTILFECSPQSTQSKITFERAYQIAEEAIQRFPEVKVVLSSKNSFSSGHPNIIDGSSITWKENAELTKYCHLLVGCSSGISWLNTSNWAKKLPMLQNIDPYYCDGKIVASVKIDFQYFGMCTDKLIELGNATNEEMINCIAAILKKDFTYARKTHHKKDKVYYGRSVFFKDVLKNGSYQKGNLSNLRLLLYLFRFAVYSKLSQNKVARKVYYYPKKIVAFLNKRG